MMWSSFSAAWHWRIDVLAVVGLATTIYLRGWMTLRRAGFERVASVRRLCATLAGWGIVGLALLSPLDGLQSRLFSAHMVQHELLMIVAPPLVLVGRPLPVALWGLPAAVRVWAAQIMRAKTRPRALFDWFTSPLAAWGTSTAILWAWHLPVAYNAVESNGMLHNLQHLCFFAAALLFWWPVIAAPPFTRRWSLPVLSAYLVAGMAQRSLLGAIIALCHHVIYSHYSAVPGSSALAALADQQLAGGIMWFGSGLVLLVIAVAVLWRAPVASLGYAGRG